MRPDLQNYWKSITMKTSENHQEDFCIYRNTFVNIVNLAEGNISKQDTKFYKAVPLKECVAIALR